MDSFWLVKHKADVVGRSLADRHYSRRKIGAPQFMPPGQTFVLVASDDSAVFGWWRPHPDCGIKAMNGFDGWTCTIFRNEGTALSSDLILMAEMKLEERFGCGPDGMMSYVDVRKVNSRNPGYCFKMAGWKPIGWSRDGKKRLFQKPFALAGLPVSLIEAWGG